MDCSICSSMPFMLRPPRNTICGACYEGAKSVITLMNKIEAADHKPNNSSVSSSPNSCKANVYDDQKDQRPVGPLLWDHPSMHFTSNIPLVNLLRMINSMKDAEELLMKKLNFLGGFVDALREQIHTDIQIKPGNIGPPVPAHRALLASRSEIFKNMLDSDGCKAAPSDTITLPELNHEELESLLEFLYSGSLSMEKLEKHVYSLFLAADKYEIPYLQEFCERHMLGSLNSSNVLDVLEISDVCSNKTLKETAMNFIVRNMEDIVFSAKYEAFVPKNSHLCVQMTRAFLLDAKSRKNSTI